MYKPRMRFPTTGADVINKSIKDREYKLANLVDKISQENDSDNKESYSQQLDAHIDAIDSIKATNRFVGKFDPLINPYSHLLAEPNKSAKKIINWEIEPGVTVEVNALQSDTENLRAASNDLMEQSYRLRNEIPKSIKTIIDGILNSSLSMLSSAEKNLELLTKQKDSLFMPSREYYLEAISRYESFEKSHVEYQELHLKIGEFIDKAYSRYDGEYIDYDTYRTLHNKMDAIECDLFKLKSDILPNYMKEIDGLIKKIKDVDVLDKNVNDPEVLITLINDQNMTNSDSSYSLNNIRYDIPSSRLPAGMFAKNPTL